MILMAISSTAGQSTARDMSRYANMVCFDCRQRLWLGKSVYKPGSQGVAYFHLGPADTPANSKQEKLTRALWRFLAEHASHQIRVVVEGVDDDDVDDEYAQIGGDRAMDISFDEYLKDFPG
jgi:hypothetical protein